MSRRRSRLVRLTKRIQPRNRRCRVVAAARQRFIENFGDFCEEIKQLDRVVEKINGSDRLLEIARAMHGQRPKPDDMDKYANPIRRYMYRALGKLLGMSPNPKYVRIEELLGIDHRCFPDLDYASEFWVYPGMLVTLRGNCFGSRRGSVAFQVAANRVYCPPIFEWSSTEVLVDYQEEAFPGNRPFNGRVWIINARGETSNALPIRTFPRYTYRGGYSYDRIILGWKPFVATTVDDTHLPGRQINDADFVVRVERQHLMDGWSMLKAPMAGGQDLAQGFHIHADFMEKAWMFLHYGLYGPIGVAGPPVAGVDWGRNELPIHLEDFRNLGLV